MSTAHCCYVGNSTVTSSWSFPLWPPCYHLLLDLAWPLDGSSQPHSGISHCASHTTHSRAFALALPSATVGGHPLCCMARDGVSAAIWVRAALYLGLFLFWGLLCLHSHILAASSLEQPLCLCFLPRPPRQASEHLVSVGIV